MRNQKGITLIALIIMIIVLLILAGVTLATVTGYDGILPNTQIAVDKYKQGAEGDQNIIDEISNLFIDYKYNTSRFENGVQTPILKKGMTAVYWEDNGREVYSRIDSNGKASSKGKTNEAFDWSKWYEYKEAVGEEDSKKSKWANVIMDDGSYFVWIPRFKYKINGTTDVDVIFVSVEDKSGAYGYTTSKELFSYGGVTTYEFLTKDTNGYILHPAFEDGSKNGAKAQGKEGYVAFNNGEWDSELAGFWVAKYEMSAEKEDGNDYQPGNVLIKAPNIMVSKPGVSSWRNINISNSYLNSINYSPSCESHMMKNSEWGAVAFLCVSKYGRNGHEISINNSTNYITGSSAGRTGDSTTKGDTVYLYNTTEGVLASTTGNIYGIYDMSGGAWERTAGYDRLSTNANMKNGTAFAGYLGESTKTYTAYENGTETGEKQKRDTVTRIGEAIKETPSWFGDYCRFSCATAPFSIHGGNYGGGAGAGVISSYNTDGGVGDGHSFRVVLAVGL